MIRNNNMYSGLRNLMQKNFNNLKNKNNQKDEAPTNLQETSFHPSSNYIPKLDFSFQDNAIALQNQILLGIRTSETAPLMHNTNFVNESELITSEIETPSESLPVDSRASLNESVVPNSEPSSANETPSITTLSNAESNTEVSSAGYQTEEVEIDNSTYYKITDENGDAYYVTPYVYHNKIENSDGNIDNLLNQYGKNNPADFNRDYDIDENGNHVYVLKETDTYQKTVTKDEAGNELYKTEIKINEKTEYSTETITNKDGSKTVIERDDWDDVISITKYDSDGNVLESQKFEENESSGKSAYGIVKTLNDPSAAIEYSSPDLSVELPDDIYNLPDSESKTESSETTKNPMEDIEYTFPNIKDFIKPTTELKIPNLDFNKTIPTESNLISDGELTLNGGVLPEVEIVGKNLSNLKINKDNKIGLLDLAGDSAKIDIPTSISSDVQANVDLQAGLDWTYSNFTDGNGNFDGAGLANWVNDNFGDNNAQHYSGDAAQNAWSAIQNGTYNFNSNYNSSSEDWSWTGFDVFSTGGGWNDPFGTMSFYGLGGGGGGEDMGNMAREDMDYKDIEFKMVQSQLHAQFRRATT